MSRKRTYGESMSSWEDAQDQRNWQTRFLDAVASKNYPLTKILLHEALSYGYEIPGTADTEVQRMMSQLGIVDR